MANIDVKEIGKNIGSHALGLAIFAGFILLMAFMILGVTKVSEFLYPISNILASIAILTFLLLILPLSLFKKLRPSMATISMILSWVCGANVWMFSFLVIVFYIHWMAVFALFFFPAVAPIAVIILLFKQQWIGVVAIVVGLVFTYGMRIFSFWLISLDEQSSYSCYSPAKPLDNIMPLYCPKCGKTYDSTWKICLKCSEKLLENTRPTQEIA